MKCICVPKKQSQYFKQKRKTTKSKSFLYKLLNKKTFQRTKDELQKIYLKNNKYHWHCQLFATKIPKTSSTTIKTFIKTSPITIRWWIRCGRNWSKYHQQNGYWSIDQWKPKRFIIWWLLFIGYTNHLISRCCQAMEYLILSFVSILIFVYFFSTFVFLPNSFNFILFLIPFRKPERYKNNKNRLLLLPFIETDEECILYIIEEKNNVQK